MSNVNAVLTGTLVELDGRLAINGVALSKPQLSILTSLGILGNKTGTVPPKGDKGKGKPANVWSVNDVNTFTITLYTAPAVVAATPAADADKGTSDADSGSAEDVTKSEGNLTAEAAAVEGSNPLSNLDTSNVTAENVDEVVLESEAA